MFLEELSLKEKKAFLEVADKLISVDNIKANEELNMLLQYRNEMNLNEKEYKIGELTLESSVKQLKKLDNVMKKKVFFELIALAMCDNNYSIEEKNYIIELQKTFSIDNDKAREFEKCVKDINIIYKKLGELINEG